MMPRILVPAEAQDKKPERKEYVLRSGTHTARDDEGNLVEYSAGEKVPLTEVQYANFQDKFEDPEKQQQSESSSKDADSSRKSGAQGDEKTGDQGKKEVVGGPVGSKPK
jgi:hypothetical protein